MRVRICILPGETPIRPITPCPTVHRKNGSQNMAKTGQKRPFGPIFRHAKTAFFSPMDPKTVDFPDAAVTFCFFSKCLSSALQAIHSCIAIDQIPSFWYFFVKRFLTSAPPSVWSGNTTFYRSRPTAMRPFPMERTAQLSGVFSPKCRSCPYLKKGVRTGFSQVLCGLFLCSHTSYPYAVPLRSICVCFFFYPLPLSPPLLHVTFSLYKR